jgi:hypothetical protein
MCQNHTLSGELGEPREPGHGQAPDQNWVQQFQIQEFKAQGHGKTAAITFTLIL